MRPSILLLALTVSGGAQASWFGSDPVVPQYSTWTSAELQQWLRDHNLYNPSLDTYSQAQLQDVVKTNWNAASTWTSDQFNSAQKAFADVRDASFDAWSESRLREFLLEQGVVAPAGPREQLVLLAQNRYKSYTAAASSMSAKASTAVYGDSTYQASKSASSLATEATNSLSSIAAQATATAARAHDDTKDYVYSSWDDNKLRKYLEDKNVIKTKTQKTRAEYLALMRDSYAKTANPVWNSWSDSYIREWLVSRGLIKSDIEHKRDTLVETLSKYYYDVTENVYTTWTDSQLKAWLVEHDIIKSDVQLKREKLSKLVGDNYLNAKTTIWSSWSDTQMREWLVDNGYLRTDAQAKRDELIKLMDSKYKDAASKTTPYLVWPDARLRAYLRQNGVSESALPTGRPGLLQEVRIRWVQTTNYADSLFSKVYDIVNNGVGAAEHKLAELVNLLLGTGSAAKNAAAEKANVAGDNAQYSANVAGEKAQYAGNVATDKAGNAAQYAKDAAQGVKTAAGNAAQYAADVASGKAQDARENVGEKVKFGGQKIKGEL